jgi:hypothetical protein
MSELSEEKINELIGLFVDYEEDFIDFDPLIEKAAHIIIKTHVILPVQLQIPLKLQSYRANLLIKQLKLLGIIKLSPGRLLPDQLIKTESELNHLFMNHDYKVRFNEFYNQHEVEIKKKIQEKRLLILQVSIINEKKIIKQEILERERKTQLYREVYTDLINQGVISKPTVDYIRREAIPQNVMDQVWNRDGGRCTKCGSQENLEFDHIIPFSKGGANTYRNLQILCKKCNVEKSNKIG